MGYLFEQIRRIIYLIVVFALAAMAINFIVDYSKTHGENNPFRIFKKQYNPNQKTSKAYQKLKNDSDYYCDRGFRYYNSKDYTRAEENFTEALTHNGFNDRAYLGIGMIYFDNKNYDKASGYLKKSIILNNKDVRPFLMLAEIHESKKDLDKAINYYKKALEVDPKNSVARKNLLRIREELFWQTKGY